MAARTGTVRPGSILRPPAAADFLARAPYARIGVAVALVGVMVAMAAFIGSIANSTLVTDGTPDTGAISANNAWTFGVATAASLRGLWG